MSCLSKAFSLSPEWRGGQLTASIRRALRARGAQSTGELLPKTIVLTDQTYRALLLRIESFDDTPEDVILRLLRQNDRAPASPAPDQLRGQEPLEEHRAEPERAAPGSILPEREYWRPILAVLAERGGSAHANDVIEAVGKRMERDLLPRDFEELRIGEIRWRNRTRFA